VIVLFKDGKTALHVACEKGCSEAVDLLLSTPGIEINLTDNVITSSNVIL
jgi:ankyrin repeat protein